MRVLVHGFIESRRLTDRAIEVLAESPVTLVGWVARPRFDWVFGESGPPCPRFEEPFPDQWRLPLGSRPLDAVVERIDDENLRYLLDREQRFADQYEVTRLRSEIVARAQEILDAATPNVIVFSDVPHSALSYALYVCGRRRGARTLYFRYGPTPNLFSFSDEIGPSLYEFVSAAAPAERGPASNESAALVERMAGSYEDATPAYIRAQKARWALSSKALATLRSAPREAVSRSSVAKVVAVAQRRRLHRWYERLAVGIEDVPRDSVALFLHLQPERSTTPEGGFFAQQWLVAHAIAGALPAGWSLAVREHPSTFVPGPRLARNRAYYEALLRIPAVRLVSTSTDPYRLIDRVRCVATVTGAVGFEAVVRGRPVLAFGDAVYRDCPGVLHIENEHNVPAALERVACGVEIARAQILDFLAAFEQSSRVVVSHEHGDDVSEAVSNGDVHAEVLRRMLFDAAAT